MKTLVLTMLLGAACAQAGTVDGAAMLAAHNRWRAQVGVGAMKYSPELAASAQAWADELKRSDQCRMRHSSPNGQYGENLYWASALSWSDGRRELQKVPASKPVDGWGSEKADYRHSDNSCKPGKVCGHYTQMVWKSSTQLGCAMAVCTDSREQVWVCRYRPAGNVVGRKPY